ncbi:hypothetical protein MMC25_007260 [Agyrium rufum]|nr:hypothetical protein [Agyrium rufum]
MASNQSRAAPWVANRDRFSDAPEVDHSAHAPQTSYGTDPQLYTEQLLEKATHIREAEDSDKYVQEQKIPREKKKPRLVKILAAVLLAILLFAGLGIGLGLGLGLKRRGDGPSVTTPPAAAPPTPSVIPQPSHGVMNDSSFAVTSTTNSRYVFFQDVNGTLRQAEWSSSSQSWDTATSLFINGTADARNNTPIAAAGFRDGSLDGDERIYLFYLTSSNLVSYKTFFGSWSDGPPTGISAGPKSRSLSIIGVPDPGFLTLFVEDSYGLAEAWFSDGEQASSLTWTNITNQLSEPANDINGQYAPFTSGYVYTYEMNESSPTYGESVSSRQFEALTLFQSIPQSISTTYDVQNNGSTSWTPSDIDSDSQWPALYHSNSDYAYCTTIPQGNFTAGQSFSFWVNGTVLMRSDEQPTNLDSSFPYKRLAATSHNSSNNIYVYHQLDSSTIAEEVYSVDESSWTSSNLTVATT